MISLYNALHSMRYGIQRRAAIIAALRSETYPRGMLVNSRHCVQIRQDPDLQHLLKKGILKRAARVSSGSIHCRHTYLTLA